MVSFAFKNVILFFMIITIAHVLLKIAIFEREQRGGRLPTSSSPSSASVNATVPASSFGERAVGGIDPNNPNTAYDENEDDLSEYPFKKSAAIDSAVAALHKSSDEDDMLRYVLEGDDITDDRDDIILGASTTPELSASWDAHRGVSRMPEAGSIMAGTTTDGVGGGNCAAVPMTIGKYPQHTQRYYQPQQQQQHQRRHMATAPTEMTPRIKTNPLLGNDTSQCVLRKYPNEGQMNGGKLFESEADGGLGGGGLKGANAFDTNFETFD
jgi:hypothetical protein